MAELDTAAMREPTDSESPDTVYNADVWELRGRVTALCDALDEARVRLAAVARELDGRPGVHEFTGPDGDGRTVCEQLGCGLVRANRVHVTSGVILASLASGVDPRAHPFWPDGPADHPYDACDLNWCQEPADHPIHQEAARG